MNSPLVKHQADKLAERLAKEEPGNERARVNLLYLLTLSRPAEADEIDDALAFLEECSQHLRAPAGADQARPTAWAQLCHAVFGSNNFLFRE